MADSFVQVAPDSSGAKMQTTTKTVNAQTVHRQVVTPASQRTRTGLYRVTDGTASGLAIQGTTAHTALATTAGTGFLFLMNPVGSSVAVAVKNLQLSLSANAATVMLTTPRITVSRFAFTGTLTYTPSGGITVAPRVRTTVAGITADAAASARAATAITGQTTTASTVIPVRSWLVPSLLTAVGAYGYTYMWDPDVEDDELILAAGEGIAIQQLDVGTASDVRRLSLSLSFEEFTAP